MLPSVEVHLLCCFHASYLQRVAGQLLLPSTPLPLRIENPEGQFCLHVLLCMPLCMLSIP